MDSDRALDVRPLTSTGFAAEVREVPLGGDTHGRPGPTTAVAEELRAAFRRHPVLCLRTSGLSADQLVGLAAAFGQPKVQLLRDERLDGRPEVSTISSTQVDRRGSGERVVFGAAWHTDDSYFAEPASATVLYAHVIPSHGGDTLFADCAAAYDALDPAEQRQLAPLRVTHQYQSRRNLNRVPKRSAEEEAETPPVSHPLVRRHPDTGRPALYLNPNRMDHVDGLDLVEGDALLDALVAHATEDRFVYRHRWQPHDVVIWDNRCTMHKACADYGDALRVMHRVLLAGSRPV